MNPSNFADATHKSDFAPADPSVTENKVQVNTVPGIEHDQFAQKHDFESYLALFETSTPIETPSKVNWLITMLKSGHWLVWSPEELQVLGTFTTEAEALSAAKK